LFRVQDWKSKGSWFRISSRWWRTGVSKVLQQQDFLRHHRNRFDSRVSLFLREVTCVLCPKPGMTVALLLQLQQFLIVDWIEVWCEWVLKGSTAIIKGIPNHDRSHPTSWEKEKCLSFLPRLPKISFDSWFIFCWFIYGWSFSSHHHTLDVKGKLLPT
jgi:hypothetical protein